MTWPHRTARMPASAAGWRLAAVGWSVHLPGVQLGAALSRVLAREPGTADPGAWADQEAVPPDKASVLLGRKGLLYKEPATRLALCAVHRALGLPDGSRPDWPRSPGTAVVACSNLGNVQTVAQVARTVATEGVRGVSILDAPNVSSNIIASTIALWFGFAGPNLMVCSGSNAGWDGLSLAALLLRGGRAERVALVGAEPDDEVASALYAADPTAAALRAGAACVVLELADRTPNGTPRRRVSVEVVPSGGPWPRVPRLLIGRDGFDPARHWGDCYGAQGVVALALAAHLVADEGMEPIGVSCDDRDRFAIVSPLTAAGGPR